MLQNAVTPVQFCQAYNMYKLVCVVGLSHVFLSSVCSMIHSVLQRLNYRCFMNTFALSSLEVELIKEEYWSFMWQRGAVKLGFVTVHVLPILLRQTAHHVLSE